MFCARCNKPLPKVDMPTVRCPGCMLVNIIPGKGPMLGIPGALPALQNKKARQWPRLAPGTALVLLIVLAIVGCQPKAKAPAKAPAAELPPVKVAKGPEAPPAAKPKTPETLPGQYLAWKIVNEYRRNKKEARQAYSGKRLTLEGNLWQVRGSNAFLAAVDTETELLQKEAVLCRMVNDIPEDVQQGDKVLIEGRCEGLAFGQLQMHECKYLGKVKK